MEKHPVVQEDFLPLSADAGNLILRQLLPRPGRRRRSAAPGRCGEQLGAGPRCAPRPPRLLRDRSHGSRGSLGSRGSGRFVGSAPPLQAWLSLPFPGDALPRSRWPAPRWVPRLVQPCWTTFFSPWARWLAVQRGLKELMGRNSLQAHTFQVSQWY